MLHTGGVLTPGSNPSGLTGLGPSEPTRTAGSDRRLVLLTAHPLPAIIEKTWDTGGKPVGCRYVPQEKRRRRSTQPLVLAESGPSLEYTDLQKELDSEIKDLLAMKEVVDREYRRRVGKEKAMIRQLDKDRLVMHKTSNGCIETLDHI